MFLINAAGLLQQCCPSRHALHVVYDGEGAVAVGRGVDDEEAPCGHRGDDAVARLRGTETRTWDVARGEDKDTPLGQGLFDMWRITSAECAGVCPDDGVARGEEPFEAASRGEWKPLMTASPVRIVCSAQRRALRLCSDDTSREAKNATFGRSSRAMLPVWS